ncbi:MAG: hypothetical protein ACYTKD_19110, partial [Planctomycetota bacterium]
SALAATSWAGQKHEIYTRVLTHDLMLLKRRARGFLQSNMQAYCHGHRDARKANTEMKAVALSHLPCDGACEFW